MAIGKGTAVKEFTSTAFKSYIGAGAAEIVCVNPNVEQIAKFYETTPDKVKEPTYLNKTKTKDKNGEEVEVDQIRLDFYAKVKNETVDFKTKISFFLSKSYKYGKGGEKILCINDYGNTAWLPVANPLVVPENMSWYDAEGIRPAYSGEEEVIGFLKALLGIKNKSYRDDNGNTITIDDVNEAKISFSDINKFFKGNIKEISEALTYQNNKVICFFGIKTTDDNKTFQTVFTNLFYKQNARNFNNAMKAINDKQKNGSYKNCIFSIDPISEYTITSSNPSDITHSVASTGDDDAFGGIPSEAPAW